jgi:hypothetical protein
MIQNYDKFSRWNVEYGKIYILWKIHIYSTMINKKTCDLLGQLYVFLIISCKIFHSKILSYEKVKKIENDSQYFCKVIPLAPIHILAPKHT